MRVDIKKPINAAVGNKTFNNTHKANHNRQHPKRNIIKNKIA